MSDDGRVTDIVDLIDNAIEDFGLSEDAMRWTPEPSGAAAYQAGEWVRANGVVLDGWQAALLHQVARAYAVPPTLLVSNPWGDRDAQPAVDRRAGFEPSLSIVDETHAWISEEAWQAAVTDQDPPPVA